MDTAPARRRLPGAARLAIGLVIVAVVVLAVAQLRGQLGEAERTARGLHPRWPLVLASGAMVLAAYAVLIETWRRVLATMGGTLGFGESARIWFVSNLARYIPGALWQMGALGKMAYDRGVSPIAAAGAAVTSTIVNVLTGLVIAFASGASGGRLTAHGRLFVALGVLALALVPVVSPRLATLASRITGKSVTLPTLTLPALVVAVVGNALAWLAYGVAFYLLARGTVGAEGGAGPYVAVYAASYLAGFLSLAPPAGIGVAEGAMVTAFAAFGIGPAGRVLVLAVVSRLWRTVLETVPGLCFVAADALRRARAPRLPARDADPRRDA